MDALTPQRIFTTLIGYQATAALALAIRLEVFTHLARGRDTLGELAEATGCSQRGLRALCSALAAHGFVEWVDGRYRCAPDAAVFLDRASPRYLGSITRFLNDARLVRHFDALGEAVRRGGTADVEGGTVRSEEPVWVEFARAMEPVARMYAEPAAEVLVGGREVRDVLDLAAGHGAYGIAIARRAPRAQVTFQDWPAVLEVARENAAAAGIGGRARFLPGSAFEVEFGGGRDLVLLPNLLHHFSREECVALLAKSRACLGAGGRVAVLEFLLDETRVSPPPSAAFDLVMLATTPRGEAYTRREYEAMFGAAGLGVPQVTQLVDPAHALFVA